MLSCCHLSTHLHKTKLPSSAKLEGEAEVMCSACRHGCSARRGPRGSSSQRQNLASQHCEDLLGIFLLWFFQTLTWPTTTCPLGGTYTALPVADPGLRKGHQCCGKTFCLDGGRMATEWQRFKHLGYLLLFSQAISRVVNWKLNSQDMNCCLYGMPVLLA